MIKEYFLKGDKIKLIAIVSIFFFFCLAIGFLNTQTAEAYIYEDTQCYNGDVYDCYLYSTTDAYPPGAVFPSWCPTVTSIGTLDYYGAAILKEDCGPNEYCDDSGYYVQCRQLCTSYDHRACYGGDVYWYDSCGNRESKINDCGSSYCDTGGDVERYCSGGDVWGVYDKFNGGCSGGSCDASWNHNSCGHTKLENCGSGETCSGGQCISSCSSHDYKQCYDGDVYWYDSCDNREDKANDCGSSYCDTGGDVYKYCSGDELWGSYDYHNQGCSGSSCYSNWNQNSCGDTMLEDCSNRTTSCGYGSCDPHEKPSWTCSGGGCTYTCNYTNSCCVSQDHKQCYDGDVYWYDSCDNREGRAEECESYETCSGGQCICNESCSSEGYSCGTFSICGTMTNCGTCGIGMTCDSGTCVAANPITSITADPEIVREKGDKSTIEWQVENYANSCEVTGHSFYETGLSGSEDTTIEGEETFTLTCTNQGETFSESVTVRLAPEYEEF